MAKVSKQAAGSPGAPGGGEGQGGNANEGGPEVLDQAGDTQSQISSIEEVDFSDVEWPLKVKVTNNSHCALHSESTGLVVGCGDHRHIELQDEAHAVAAIGGLVGEIQSRGYPPESIVIEGLPAKED